MPGLGASFGRGGATNFQQDFQQSDCVWIQGSSLVEAHPVGSRWMMKARERGAKIIHVDPHYSRTSAVSDIYVQIRAGTDIAFLGGLIRHIIESGSYFRDYVINYTNAPVVIDQRYQGPEELEGLFSGFDPASGTYDRTTWMPHDAEPPSGPGEREQTTRAFEEQTAAGMGLADVPMDPTLEHPSCVFQIIGRHYARYTPEMVAWICGCSERDFLRVADALIENSGRERTTMLAYAVGWTQHSTGVQMIRAGSIVQLLLGNVGRPGGGVMAMRGHASIQGSSDIPTLYDLLPGYLRATRSGRFPDPGERPCSHRGRHHRGRRRGNRDDRELRAGAPKGQTVTHQPDLSPEQRILRRFKRQDSSPTPRDMTPAVGTRGGPAAWKRAVDGSTVAGARPGWADANWSYLYKQDTRYREHAPDEEAVRAAARRMRSGTEVPEAVEGPVMHPAVWTWEIPLYFWFGGIATGSSFVALAADLTGDPRSAAAARKLALAAVTPSAPLLVLDLGRPLRFLHMLRVFKPRSPMSMGAWCLTAFTTVAGAAVAADVLGRDRVARRLGAVTAALGGYLGSYTGTLLASTAVPVWAGSRAMLPPIFVATATATGAAATRLTLAAADLPQAHPTQVALGTIETGAMAAELTLSKLNERKLGPGGQALEAGVPGKLFRLAKTGVLTGQALRLARRGSGAGAQHLASLLYLASGLLFRFAWVGAGRTSARDDQAVARAGRQQARG